MNLVSKGSQDSEGRQDVLDHLVLKVNQDLLGTHCLDLVKEEMVWMVYQEGLDLRVNQDRKGTQDQKVR